MVVCILCSSDIHDDCQYYNCYDMGPEIISTIENIIGHEVNGTICEDCFANIQIMFAAHNDLFSVKEEDGIQHVKKEHELQEVNDEYELQHQDQNVCVWCQFSLYRKRTHSLPIHARHFVAESVSPRNVPEGGLVCYACWLRIVRYMKQKGLELPPESSDTPAINLNKCVWCLRSLDRIRSHSLPEGPERDEVITRIFPREIPAQGRVCYACWVSARRNVQKAQNIDEARDDTGHHRNVFCALCGMSLFRRQTRILASGPQRDKLAARIFPRELSGNLLCTNCWSVNISCAEQLDQDNLQQQTTIELEFTHTTNSSSRCFVPSCTNPERLQVPNDLRKLILTSQKVFVTDNAKICSEHKSLSNWEFLDKNEFSNSFTKKEIQSMLDLSILELNQARDLKNRFKSPN